MSVHGLRRYFVVSLSLVSLAWVFISPAMAQTSVRPGGTSELQRSFASFLGVYRGEIKRRNAAYLESVHPKLPKKMHEIFFDVTLQMMRYSEQQGLAPKIECQDFKVCKAVYPQPNDGWAAQRFILHENRWRWLDQ